MDSDSALRKSRRLEMMEKLRPAYDPGGWEALGCPKGGFQGEDIRVGARRGRDSPGIETSLGVSASGAPLPPHGQKPRDEWDSRNQARTRAIYCTLQPLAPLGS